MLISENGTPGDPTDDYAAIFPHPLALVFAMSVGFPTVPVGKARIRTIVTATHTREELSFALDAFGTAARELGVSKGVRT